MRDRNVIASDGSLYVWELSFEAAHAAFDAMEAELVRLGFAIRPCERTAKDYPTLANNHRVGSHGDLQISLSYFGITAEVVFWQEKNRSNPHGGRYDFDKVKRMDYLTRLRFIWARTHLLALLAGLGIPLAPARLSMGDGNDPLKAFNSGWGADRFRRGPDGWPDDKELSCWSRKNADGVIVSNGDTQFIRPYWAPGRWMRCKVYGGINGMWHCLCNGIYLNNVNVGSLRSTYPGRGRKFEVREINRVLEGRLENAVKAKKFLIAAAIQGEIERRGKTKPKE